MTIKKSYFIGIMLAVALVGAFMFGHAEVIQGQDMVGPTYQITNLPPELVSYVQGIQGVVSVQEIDPYTTFVETNQKLTNAQQDKIRTTLDSLDLILKQNRARIGLVLSAKLPLCMEDQSLQQPVGYYSNGGKIISVLNDSRCYE